MMKQRLSALAAALLLASPAAAMAHRANGAHRLPSPGRAPGGLVYVMSNSATGNTVAVLKRTFYGGLETVQIAPAGGWGTGVGQSAAPDPLGSQNELLLSRDHQWLFAVDAGSNQISVFRVRGERLHLIDVVSSGGTYPVSLAQRGERLYVLNAGGHSNIASFDIGYFGRLHPLRNGVRPLGIDVPLSNGQPDVGHTPAQIGFSRDQRWLVVTMKNADAKGRIGTFRVDRLGNLAQRPVITASLDAQPFGFDFDASNHLLVSEAGGNSASSYVIARNGRLRPVSLTVADGQQASCWLVAGNGFAYVSNPGSNSISTFRVDRNGALHLVDGTAAVQADGSLPLDLKLSGDGRYLYTLDPGHGDVSSYRVGHDGHLALEAITPLFTPLSGMQGLAVD